MSDKYVSVLFLAQFEEGQGIVPKHEKVLLVVPQEQLKGVAWQRGEVFPL